MKKLIAVLFVFILMAGLTNAQSKMQLGVGGFVGMPMGTFGDVTSLGFGGAVQGEYELGDKMVGTFTTGYLIFSGKEETIAGLTVKYGDWSVIPLMVGTKYYFADDFYGAVQAGLNMVSYTVPSQTFFGFTTPETTVSSSEFGYAVGVGYGMGAVDLFAKYGSFGTNATYVGLTALYKFGL
ncbi:MAG: hypothetical protein K8H86_04605 [Ignavibacteriaceae bacterium]|nr:hypothetical protein [Ignavibacteriaceae bacterium]